MFEPDGEPFPNCSPNVIRSMAWRAHVEEVLGTPVIEFRTLGTLDLRGADGRELHALLAQPKRIALLAYLCIARPRGFHHRDTLFGLFWPNVDQDHARTSLRKALHILRRALGDGVILSRGDEEVAVDFQHVSCDAALFEESLRTNRLEEALDLYRGDLLTGFFIDEAPEFEHWLASERTRLRSGAAHAAYAMSDRLEASGNLGAAVSWAHRSLELADTDERALRKLIELQCKTGDRAGAIKAYETFARHLAVEYEMKPSAATQSLIEQIRSDSELPRRETEVKAAAVARIGPSVAVSAIADATRWKESSSRERTRLFPALALVTLILGIAIWAWVRPAPAKQVVRYTLAFDASEEMVPGSAWSGRLALSPDGSRLAYIGGPNAQLLIRPRNQLRATAVPETEKSYTPFFSPDGSQVGFLREWNVQIASINGGPPITVTDTLTGVAGASWGRDGFIYADGAQLVGLLRFEAKPGAVPKWFTTLDTARGEVDHTWPDVLPNGKGVLFTDTFSGKNAGKDTTTFAIAIADIPSGKHRVLVDDAMYARYAVSGHLLYVTTNRRLMVVPFDQNSMKVTGTPTALIEGMRLGSFGSADLAVSEAGTLVFAAGGGEDRQELVWVTRDGKAQTLDPDWEGGAFQGPALSPDGKRLAVMRRRNVGGSSDIWIKQLDQGPSIKLTFEGRDNYAPAWTPDGRFVTFCSNAAGSFDLWTKRADGSAQPVRHRFHEKRDLIGARWAHDGKWLIFQTLPDTPGSGDILGARPGIDTVPVPLVATAFTETSPALSPDDRWLAYASNETNRNEIYVVPFPSAHAAKWAVSSHGGTEPQWSHSGSELFYRDGSGNLVAVEVKTTPTFSLARSTVLFPAGGFYSFPLVGPQYATSTDDQRFLMIRPQAASVPDKLIVVENWFEELRAKSRK
jgi:DNA-binding SARP family transcriptional activator/Tol biopolymer transport system component